MKFDPIIKEIITEVCSENGAAEEDMELMLECLFKDIKKVVQLPEMPKILIHNWGTFKPSVGKISKQVAWYNGRLKKGFETQESYQAKIDKLVLVRDRLLEEGASIDRYKYLLSLDNHGLKTITE